MNEDILDILVSESAKVERDLIRKGITQLLSESIDLQDFHDKMAKYFNEEE